MDGLVRRYILDSVVNSVGITTLFGGQSLKYLTSGASQSYVLTILLGVGVLADSRLGVTARESVHGNQLSVLSHDCRRLTH